jgi:hypothetical protein
MKAGMAKNEEILENILQNFNRLYLGFWAEHLKNIKTFWRDVLSDHFKRIRLSLGAAVEEKTAAEKPKKNQNIGYPQGVGQCRGKCHLLPPLKHWEINMTKQTNRAGSDKTSKSWQKLPFLPFLLGKLPIFSGSATKQRKFDWFNKWITNLI